ncbi:hypothetical protein, partial [Serratia marcescens]|uniref:hypothetical protein n=1 Tax=Serratia marcescens TaxID=615 RepID=UPI001C375B65
MTNTPVRIRGPCVTAIHSAYPNLFRHQLAFLFLVITYQHFDALFCNDLRRLSANRLLKTNRDHHFATAMQVPTNADGPGKTLHGRIGNIQKF